MLYRAMKKNYCRCRRHRQCCPRRKARAFVFSFAFCSTNKLPHGIIASHHLDALTPLAFSRRRGSHQPSSSPHFHLPTPLTTCRNTAKIQHIIQYMSTRTHTPLSLHAPLPQTGTRHLPFLYSSLYVPYICLLIYSSRTVFSFFFIQSCFFVILFSPVDTFLFVFLPLPFAICHICLFRHEFCCIYSFPLLLRNSRFLFIIFLTGFL
jgi:hypothetical protein